MAACALAVEALFAVAAFVSARAAIIDGVEVYAAARLIRIIGLTCDGIDSNSGRATGFARRAQFE